MEQTSKIVGGLSEFKENKTGGKSLLQRIEEANNETEVNYLLGVGKTYKKASVGTMRSWVKAASQRMEKIKSE
jgi:hypothetical protein